MKSVISLLLTASTLNGATIFVNEENKEYFDSNDESYLFYYDKKKSDISGEILTTSAGGSLVTVTGYNDGNLFYDPIDNPFVVEEQSITISDVGSVIYEGTEYLTFYLDANQKGGTYYDVKELEVYTSSIASFDSYNDVQSGSLAFKLDSPVSLYYGQGTSNWDIALYIPKENFEIFEGGEDLTYITLYVKYEDTAGFDHWGYDRAQPEIPEPEVPALASIGTLIFILRLRKR